MPESYQTLLNLTMSHNLNLIHEFIDFAEAIPLLIKITYSVSISDSDSNLSTLKSLLEKIIRLVKSLFVGYTLKIGISSLIYLRILEIQTSIFYTFFSDSTRTAKNICFKILALLNNWLDLTS